MDETEYDDDYYDKDYLKENTETDEHQCVDEKRRYREWYNTNRTVY